MTDFATTLRPTFRHEVGTTYTFVWKDDGNIVTGTNVAAITFTIPPRSAVKWPGGATLTVIQLGAGKITFAAGAGVTIVTTEKTITGIGKSAMAIQDSVTLDTWHLIGALE